MMLQKARSKSKVNSPGENLEMKERFQNLPNELDDLRDLKHSLQAKADLCEGIDREVR